MNNTFLHSGDLGDIIYSLPTIKELGGGVLYLNPAAELRFKNYPLITKLTEKSALQIRSILLQQKYIDDVKIWNGEEITYNLDNFRTHINFNNLAISHLDIYKLSPSVAFEKWIETPKLRKLPKRFIISRSVRYHSNYVEWVRILNIISTDSIFIGLPKEHEIFEYTFDVKIPYYPTPELTDIYETIASCERIFCNQSFPHALAEGLSHPLNCEIFRPYPAAVFLNKATSSYF
jgi:hypothetical protein